MKWSSYASPSLQKYPLPPLNYTAQWWVVPRWKTTTNILHWHSISEQTVGFQIKFKFFFFQSVHVQCIKKVFRLLGFFSLILKLIKLNIFLNNLHTIPHNGEEKTGFWKCLQIYWTEIPCLHKKFHSSFESGAPESKLVPVFCVLSLILCDMNLENCLRCILKFICYKSNLCHILRISLKSRTASLNVFFCGIYWILNEQSWEKLSN